MKLLAFDTATDACSAALWLDGAVREEFALVRHGHSERLLPMIETLLADSGLGLRALDAIAFGRGPGAFTGLRIAAGVAQGLAYGADLPVVPISTLAALAEMQDAPRVFAALDARMAQLYWGAYVRAADGGLAVAVADRLSDVDTVALPAGAWLAVGSGAEAYAVRLRGNLPITAWREGQYPRAAGVARLAAAAFARGESCAPELALPVYLRDEVAKKSPI